MKTLNLLTNICSGYNWLVLFDIQPFMKFNNLEGSRSLLRRVNCFQLNFLYSLRRIKQDEPDVSYLSFQNIFWNVYSNNASGEAVILALWNVSNYLQNMFSSFLSVECHANSNKSRQIPFHWSNTINPYTNYHGKKLWNSINSL